MSDKKKYILSVIIALTAAAVCVLCAKMSEQATEAVRIGLIIGASVVLIAGITTAIVIDLRAGCYECPECGERFVPSAKAYIMGVHTINRRRLKCPHCGKKSFCIRKL